MGLSPKLHTWTAGLVVSVSFGKIDRRFGSCQRMRPFVVQLKREEKLTVALSLDPSGGGLEGSLSNTVEPMSTGALSNWGELVAPDVPRR